MSHLLEEELIDRYYGASDRGVERHLETCAECAAAFAALKSELNAVRGVEIPERDADYGERMWSRVAQGLPALPAIKAPVRRLPMWRGLAYAAGFACLVAGTFMGGRIWEHRHQPQIGVTASKAPAPSHPQQRVVVVVLGDHLDRSERLLIELKHADAEDAELDSPLRDEARSLLAANHKLRNDAEKSGDPALTKALGHLDKLLNELASRPESLSPAAIEKLQNEMNRDGLLFEVRVLRSRISHRQSSAHNTKGGTA